MYLLFLHTHIHIWEESQSQRNFSSQIMYSPFRFDYLENKSEFSFSSWTSYPPLDQPFPILFRFFSHPKEPPDLWYIVAFLAL